ncbi:MAG: hypothetical protein U5Q16_16300 [Gammaproteobacteria bacterium]|nr:hypothetical protein [Gammaproteobacteria bacterium]
MSQHEQATFTQGGDVIEHTVNYLRRIADVIDDVRQQDNSERVGMLLDCAELEQRELIGALERLLDDAPQKVMETYAQYTVELPAEIQAPDVQSTLDLIQWLSRYNSAVHETFTELAETADGGEITEVFGGIAEQIQAHEQRLSKEYQRLEDL